MTISPTTTGSETGTTIAPVLASSAGNTVSLNQYFSDATLPGTLVSFNTSEGEIQVGLTDAATPLTVANFLSYVESGAYTGTFFHRSASFEGTTPSATTPADIIQAGGFNISNGSIASIATNAPVQDEYTSELYGDVAGTIAMAKTSQADSATSEFYFNENDNSQALDTPTTDSNGVMTSYTVFGKVLSGGPVVKDIAELPTYNLGSALTDVPVTGLTASQISSGASLGESNLVFINSVSSEPGTSYTVTSDVPSLVTPTVTNGVLTLGYTAGQYGTAEISVVATNLDGTSATETFPVTVPNPASPGQGPVAQAFTSQGIVTGTKGVIHTLANATDSVSPLTNAGVTIVSPPAHGVATVDPTTGYIDYTSTTGYVGNDTLTYSITDAAGTVSAPVTLTVDVVPTAVKITIGTAGAKTMVITQPDGATGTLSVASGTAVVTFTSYQVSSSTSAAGVVTVSGPGATITDITITNVRGTGASLSLQSASAMTLGSVNDTGDVATINAPNSTMTGSTNLASIRRLDVAATQDASINLGNNGTFPILLIGVATDTSVSATNIGIIQSRQWLTKNNSSNTISAATIKTLNVTGAFQEDLKLVSRGYELTSATVAQPSGSWLFDGSVRTMTVTSPASSWSVDSAGLIGKLTVKGTLSSTIQAGAITSLSVIGTADGAVVQTNATFSKKFVQLSHMSVTGAMTNSVIFAAGNIGSITAASMTGSRIYAGILLATAQGGALPTGTTDFSSAARIASVSLGRGSNAFSNSQINASILGSINLGNIDTSSSGVPDGIAAESGTSIVGYLGKTRLALGAAQLRAAGKTSAADVLAAYLTKKKITLPDGDFAIDLY
jgi:cyclophilin family peptidyl-prolyl cis-trans isomerase